MRRQIATERREGLNDGEMEGEAQGDGKGESDEWMGTLVERVGKGG